MGVPLSLAAGPPPGRDRRADGSAGAGFGLASAAMFLGEPRQGWKLAATALVLGGLAVNLLWGRHPTLEE